jgi:methionyl-tRNA formyltransferase
VTLRIAFLGNDPWSVPSLEAIHAEPDLSIELVVTNLPKPAGRGSVLTPTAVAGAARALDVPLVEAPDVREGDGHRALLAAHPDVVVVVAYGHILSRDTLDLAPHGAINVHFSLLPRWRGAAPVQHALLAGDPVTGVTVMRMDEGLDTGPILNQMEEPIRPEDDAASLGGRLARIGGFVLVGVLRMIPRGGVPERPQDGRHATLAPRPGPSERTLDWDQPAVELVRRVRAFAPSPGAVTTFRGDVVKVLRAAADHQAPVPDEPGTIVGADERGVLVTSGVGGVRLLEVAPAGRKRMSASQWARGARFMPGERLG